MKKKNRKLGLNRETLRQLEIGNSHTIAAGLFTERETCGATCKVSCGEVTRCSICCP